MLSGKKKNRVLVMEIQVRAERNNSQNKIMGALALGGGYFVSSNNVWYLRGIFASFAINEDGTCDISKPAIFTDILEFKDWVDEIMKKFPSNAVPQTHLNHSFKNVSSKDVNLIGEQTQTTEVFLRCDYVSMKVVHRPEDGSM